MNQQIASKIRKIQRGLFDWTVTHHPGLGMEKRAESFVQLFENHLPEESRILDIGGSWGFYGEPLARRGHHLTVLDVVKPALPKVPVVIYEPGRKFPFPDKSFDAAMFITVLHHIPDPESVIREAKRVTKNVVILVEDVYHHAAGRLWTQLRDQIYNFEFFGHPCQFKKGDEWIRLFEKMDFKLLERKNVYTWLAGLRILNGVFAFEVPSR